MPDAPFEVGIATSRMVISAMPDTTVQKMIGAITILINLMKPSPSALIQSLVASAGHSQPNRATSTIAIKTWT
jgi:hypothetical protein